MSRNPSFPVFVLTAKNSYSLLANIMTEAETEIFTLLVQAKLSFTVLSGCQGVAMWIIFEQVKRAQYSLYDIITNQPGSEN